MTRIAAAHRELLSISLLVSATPPDLDERERKLVERIREHAHAGLRAVEAMLGEPPGSLLDCAAIQRELGISRHAAERIMRQLPVVEPPGLDKVYVKREDLEGFIETATRRK